MDIVRRAPVGDFLLKQKNELYFEYSLTNTRTICIIL